MSVTARSGWGVLLTALSLSLPGLAGTADLETALAEGNRKFGKDETEAALETYARGYADGRSPVAGVLAYNAGTCALQLGRLPEALLWFRRAEVLATGDPWLRDNLALARHALGDPPEAEPAWSLWLARRRWIAAGGVVLAWAGFGLLLLLPRLHRGWFAGLVLLAGAAFAAGSLLDRIGPRAAVLLAACPAPGGGLPAGSEVWVLPAGRGWRVLGEGRELRCPPNSVALVEP